MLCESCGKNTAVIRVKAIVNGEPVEYALCSECAHDLGYANLLFDMLTGYDGTLNDFFPDGEDAAEVKHCPCCGASFQDILRSGKIGCAECYHTFADQLAPFLRKIHGSVSHRGKTAGGGDLPQVLPKAQLSVMHQQLREAIQSENFEQAAALRDKIHEMEEDGQ
ncbi:MAG: UvrB/UvrC motif-containing protein [Oscillospiraceae bacterium]|jgi:protein arginine kinase activator|nr:UvrB/UvrC motif-containing protein [Oscillospiraceae bacterium]